MRRKKKQEGLTPGGIEVFANHEEGLVYLRIAPQNEKPDDEVFVCGVQPEYGRELAQRITLATILVEEGPDADM